ncbi:ATP-dependent DNA helicase RecG [Bordetella ansorpii]|uniref:ATP-dependent DNA helicase RecG n=1 Tax=Bordetella ansorpii TaxID=288768 RepID=A0A157SXN8_9BORD|nr:ATP-dependent DNA helicase RecG [Bordetella ansorpii]
MATRQAAAAKPAVATRPRRKAPAESRPKEGRGAASLVERKLQSLGLHGPEDFLLHLPLRYEDETRVVPIGSLRPGYPAQVEGEVLRSEVMYRPRRQLTAVLADDSGELQLRWLNFYPSQQKQLEKGRRLRARAATCAAACSAARWCIRA